MGITVVGAGNVGTQMAVHGAEKGHEVMVYTSKPQRICKKLFIFNEEGKVSHQGVIAGSTLDPERVFRDAEVVFVTVPAFCMKEMAECIVPWAHKGMTVCLVPGIGGGEHAFFACRRKGAGHLRSAACSQCRPPDPLRGKRCGHWLPQGAVCCGITCRGRPSVRGNAVRVV